ncbi:MAG: glycosyltransferase family 2 protein [Proteobacteria bacterium]|nr:glycosyltransferase family 2 protein [Pseudomonadota bacterium]
MTAVNAAGVQDGVSPMKLSALVCAQNDEARLAECLRRLDFCDEIVVVADRCLDRTQEIARQFGARVIDGIFPLESQRKAAGLSSCLGEWILEIEPDEQVSPALAYEIRAAICGQPAGDWFDLPIHNYLGETLVRRGWGAGLGEAISPRLYRHRAKRWRAGRIDVVVVMDGRRAGALETPLTRRAAADLATLFAEVDRVAGLRAQDLADAGDGGRLGGDVLRAAGRFWASYVWRRGLREGELGFLLALMSAAETVICGVRARQLIHARTVAPVTLPAAANEQPATLGLAVRR